MTESRGRRGRFHVVLLAGGSGTRFWPLSRGWRPKQFLDLAGPESLIAATWRRVSRLAKPDTIWVVAPAALAREVRNHLPSLRRDRLLLEPSPRDTAPAIGLACARIREEDPNAVIAVFPTDHVIRQTAPFVRAVRAARRAAEKGALVCLGVRPDRPATGFGYLKCRGTPRPGQAIEVERFVEKPDLARARRFVRSGAYLWNGGMFVWRAERFLDELSRTAPETHAAVTAAARGRKAAWMKAEKRSVDYAVMEQARGVMVVPLDAGWDDVGSWEAAARLRGDGPAPAGSLLVDSPGSVVFGGSRCVAIVGAAHLVVVDTPDALLVVSRDATESVRKVVEELRARGRRELL